MRQAIEVFAQNDGEVTKAYYAELSKLGPLGELAVALFRAQKRSSAAKKYRGGRYRRAAYDVKNWSLSEICRILIANPQLGIVWGWRRDPNAEYHAWVLYVEVLLGQVSFHCADRLAGPDYPKDWDGVHQSAERILAFCDRVTKETHANVLST